MNLMYIYEDCVCVYTNVTVHLLVCLQVTIVRWNKHLDKIATCDSLGSVIVWRNQEGRSIMELVNHRGIAISDFQWSNDGQKVLISYTDGYVLVGTATGRRLWARRLNIGTYVTHNTTPARTSELLSSTWSADDSRVVVGSSIGELIELDANDEGRLISTTEVLPGIGIIGLQWVRVPDQNRPERLSLYLKNGKVVLMSSCGDQHATIIKTGLIEGCMQWSEDGNVLAVAGYRRTRCQSTVRFFSPSGSLLFTLPLGTKVSHICLPTYLDPFSRYRNIKHLSQTSKSLCVCVCTHSHPQ